jgi:transposase
MGRRQVNLEGVVCRSAPRGYGPHKTLCNRFIRWSRLGVFARIFATLAAAADAPAPLMKTATVRHYCSGRTFILVSLFRNDQQRRALPEEIRQRHWPAEHFVRAPVPA